MGFKNKFKSDKTSTTTIDDPKLSTDTPGIKYAKMYTIKAVARILIIHFIFNYLLQWLVPHIFLHKYEVNLIDNVH